MLTIWKALPSAETWSLYTVLTTCFILSGPGFGGKEKRLLLCTLVPDAHSLSATIVQPSTSV